MPDKIELETLSVRIEADSTEYDAAAIKMTDSYNKMVSGMMKDIKMNLNPSGIEKQLLQAGNAHRDLVNQVSSAQAHLQINAGQAHRELASIANEIKAINGKVIEAVKITVDVATVKDQLKEVQGILKASGLKVEASVQTNAGEAVGEIRKIIQAEDDLQKALARSVVAEQRRAAAMASLGQNPDQAKFYVKWIEVAEKKAQDAVRRWGGVGNMLSDHAQMAGSDALAIIAAEMMNQPNFQQAKAQGKVKRVVQTQVWDMLTKAKKNFMQALSGQSAMDDLGEMTQKQFADPLAMDPSREVMEMEAAGSQKLIQARLRAQEWMKTLMVLPTHDAKGGQVREARALQLKAMQLGLSGDSKITADKRRSMIADYMSEKTQAFIASMMRSEDINTVPPPDVIMKKAIRQVMKPPTATSPRTAGVPLPSPSIAYKPEAVAEAIKPAMESAKAGAPKVDLPVGEFTQQLQKMRADFDSFRVEVQKPIVISLDTSMVKGQLDEIRKEIEKLRMMQGGSASPHRPRPSPIPKSKDPFEPDVWGTRFHTGMPSEFREPGGLRPRKGEKHSIKSDTGTAAVYVQAKDTYGDSVTKYILPGFRVAQQSTNEERQAAKEYTGDMHRDLNRILRGVGNQSIHGYSSGYIEETIAGLTAITNKGRLPKGNTLFRGIGPEGSKYAFQNTGGVPVIGSTVSDKGILSFSLDKHHAHKFYRDGGHILRYTTKKDDPGYFLGTENLTKEKREQEVLLPPGSAFRIIGVSGKFVDLERIDRTAEMRVHVYKQLRPGRKGDIPTSPNHPVVADVKDMIKSATGLDISEIVPETRLSPKTGEHFGFFRPDAATQIGEAGIVQISVGSLKQKPTQGMTHREALRYSLAHEYGHAVDNALSIMKAMGDSPSSYYRTDFDHKLNNTLRPVFEKLTLAPGKDSYRTDQKAQEAFADLFASFVTGRLDKMSGGGDLKNLFIQEVMPLIAELRTHMQSGGLIDYEHQRALNVQQLFKQQVKPIAAMANKEALIANQGLPEATLPSVPKWLATPAPSIPFRVPLDEPPPATLVSPGFDPNRGLGYKSPLIPAGFIKGMVESQRPIPAHLTEKVHKFWADFAAHQRQMADMFPDSGELEKLPDSPLTKEARDFYSQLSQLPAKLPSFDKKLNPAHLPGGNGISRYNLQDLAGWVEMKKRLTPPGVPLLGYRPRPVGGFPGVPISDNAFPMGTPMYEVGQHIPRTAQAAYTSSAADVEQYKMPNLPEKKTIDRSGEPERVKMARIKAARLVQTTRDRAYSQFQRIKMLEQHQGTMAMLQMKNAKTPNQFERGQQALQRAAVRSRYRRAMFYNNTRQQMRSARMRGQGFINRAMSLPSPPGGTGGRGGRGPGGFGFGGGFGNMGRGFGRIGRGFGGMGGFGKGFGLGRLQSAFRSGITNVVDDASSTVRSKFAVLAGLLQYSLISMGMSMARGLVVTELHFYDQLNRSMAKTSSNPLFPKKLGENKLAAEQEIFKMSGNGIQGPVELAKALGVLNRSGMDTRDTLSALGISERFATANSIDATESAHMLAKAYMALDLKTDDSAKSMENFTHLSDLLTKASGMADVSVEELAAGLSGRGALSLRQLNIGLEDSVAYLTALNQAGFRGAAGGVALTTLYKELEQSGVDHADVWKLFKMEGPFDKEGKMRPLDQILGQFQKRFAGRSDQEQRAAFEALGLGGNSQRGGIQAILAMSSEGKIREGLSNVGGETNKVASMIEGSLLSALKNLWNQFQILAIQLGKDVAPALRFVTELVVMAVKAWTGLSEANRRAIEMMALLIILVPVAIVLFRLLFNLLAGAASIIIAPFVFLIKIIIAVISLVGYVLVTALITAIQVVTGLFSVLSKVVGVVVDLSIGILQIGMGIVQLGFAAVMFIGSGIVKYFEMMFAIISVLSHPINALSSSLSSISRAVVAFAANAASAIASAFVQLPLIIISAIPLLLAILGIIGSVMVVGAGLSAMWEPFKATGVEAWGAIQDHGEQALAGIERTSSSVWGNIRDFAIEAWMGVREGSFNALDEIKANLEQFIPKAMGFFANFEENSKIIIQWLRENWRDILSDLIDLIKVGSVAIGNDLEVLGGVIARVFMNIWENVKTGGDDFKRWWEGLIDDLVLIFQNGMAKTFRVGIEAMRMKRDLLLADDLGTGIGKNMQEGIKTGYVNAKEQSDTDINKVQGAVAMLQDKKSLQNLLKDLETNGEDQNKFHDLELVDRDAAFSKGRIQKYTQGFRYKSEVKDALDQIDNMTDMTTSRFKNNFGVDISGIVKFAAERGLNLNMPQLYQSTGERSMNKLPDEAKDWKARMDDAMAKKQARDGLVSKPWTPLTEGVRDILHGTKPGEGLIGISNWFSKWIPKTKSVIPKLNLTPPGEKMTEVESERIRTLHADSYRALFNVMGGSLEQRAFGGKRISGEVYAEDFGMEHLYNKDSFKLGLGLDTLRAFIPKEVDDQLKEAGMVVNNAIVDGIDSIGVGKRWKVAPAAMATSMKIREWIPMFEDIEKMTGMHIGLPGYAKGVADRLFKPPTSVADAANDHGAGDVFGPIFDLLAGIYPRFRSKETKYPKADAFPTLPVHGAVGDTFKEINLNRFVLDGPGGLSREGHKGQLVHSPEILNKLDQINNSVKDGNKKDEGNGVWSVLKNAVGFGE